MKSTLTSKRNQFNRNTSNVRSSFAVFATIICIGFVPSIFAQSIDADKVNRTPSLSPVVIGSVIGNNGVHLETFFSKSFNANSPFGVFGIMDLYGVYNTSEQPIQNQQMAQIQMTYRILEGLNVSAGAFFEIHSGFRPTVGLQYSLFAGDFHFLLAPRFDLSQTFNGEILGNLEYTPKIKNDWSVYSRVQGLYNRDLKNGIHSVSYVWGRLGASYKTYRFGVGGNFYSLGPQKIKENNYGLFVGVLLF